jgi:hypothetical protein
MTQEITEEERKELVKIYSDLNLPTDKLAYNQSDFNKYHTLHLNRPRHTSNY